MGRLIIAVFGIFLSAGYSHAAVLSIDADGFSEGDNLSNAFPGLTLTAIGGGRNTTGNVFAVDPQNPVYSFFGNFTASTGSLVFGHDGFSDFSGRHDEIGHLWASHDPTSLRVDFSRNTDFISIDFIADDFSDFGSLQAFNSSGVLLDTYLTGSLATNEFETMAIIRSQVDISYIIATGINGHSGGLDNLQYNAVVPVPAAIILFISGLASMTLFRKKRNNTLVRYACCAARSTA